MRVGVLALQGAFREHRLALERLGARVTEVRQPAHLDGLSGLVMPGGESTAIAKLLVSSGLHEALQDFHAAGKPIWGTCAGAILLATGIAGRPEQPRLGLLDITVARNDYGRQVASFETDLEVSGLETPFHAIFIRAPRIIATGPGVRVLASLDGDPVMVEGNGLSASVFHPELSGDDRLHGRFLATCEEAAAQ